MKSEKTTSGAKAPLKAPLTLFTSQILLEENLDPPPCSFRSLPPSQVDEWTIEGLRLFGKSLQEDSSSPA